MLSKSQCAQVLLTIGVTPEFLSPHYAGPLCQDSDMESFFCAECGPFRTRREPTARRPEGRAGEEEGERRDVRSPSGRYFFVPSLGGRFLTVPVIGSTVVRR
jgi:hypothetical protein